VNGGAQLGWLGGGFSRYLVDLGGWPGWHISGDWPSAGFQAYYPAAKARVSTDVFSKQAAAAVQLVSVLLVKDPIALAPAWGYLQVAVTTLDDKAFSDPSRASAARANLTKDFDAVFAEVKAANYRRASALLPAMSVDADRLLTPKDADAVKAAVAAATKMAEHGVARTAKRL
jgi:hypothetical protein